MKILKSCNIYLGSHQEAIFWRHKMQNFRGGYVLQTPLLLRALHATPLMIVSTVPSERWWLRPCLGFELLRWRISLGYNFVINKFPETTIKCMSLPLNYMQLSIGNGWHTHISSIVHTLRNFMNNSLWSDEVTKSSRALVADQVSNFTFRYLLGHLDTCWVI